MIAKAFGKLLRKGPYYIEQVPFVLSLIPYIYRKRPDIIFFSDGNVGNAVGTVQEDENKAHTHPYTFMVATEPQSGDTTECWTCFTTIPTGSTGGNEARPKNRTALFAIYY